MSAQDAALPPEGGGRILDRLFKLELHFPQLEERGRSNSKRLGEVEKQVAVMTQVQLDTREDVSGLKQTLDRLVWAVVGLALTIAGSTIAFALTLSQ